MKKQSISLCTVSDKNYLIRTITLYLSLKKTTTNFKLYVLCLDSLTYKILSKLKLRDLEPISIADIEDKELKKIKSERTWREYAWTLKSSIIYYLLSNKKITNLIYVDSDITFFENAQNILKYVKSHSIGITPHNFPNFLKPKEKTVGKYNSGVVYFKNDNEGKRCAYDWKEKCIKYCKYEVSDKGVGDQIYLEDWPEKFKNLIIIQHHGINLAPWSVSNYEVTKRNNKIYINTDELICYHFHGFKTHSTNQFTNTFGYSLDKNTKKFIYEPYQALTRQAISIIMAIVPTYKYGIEKKNMTMSVINYFYKYIAPAYSKFVELTGFQYKIYKN